MLPKKNRTPKKVVAEVFEKGKFLNSPHLSFKFIFDADEQRKFSFIVPKSVSKSAVERNNLRRLGYTALEKSFSSVPKGVQGVFIFKKYQDSVSILENEIKNVLNKIN